MKNARFLFLAGAVAVGLTLWPTERDQAREKDRASARIAVANDSSVPMPAESFESASTMRREQFLSRGKGEPWAKGEIDDLLIAWRAWLASANAAEVVRALSPEELASPLGSAALEAWLARDSVAASAWIADRPEATDHHAWLVARAHVEQPQIFTAFCLELSASTWSQAFLDHSARERMRLSPAAAVAVAGSLTPGERQTRAFEAIASDWMLRDPDAARVWIDGVVDPSLRQRLVEAGAQSYASTDPLGALEWLLAQSLPDAALQEPVHTIAGIWRHTASSEVIDWLEVLADTVRHRAGGTPPAQ